MVAGHTTASRHRGSQQDPIVRASLFRNTIEAIHDVANGGIPSCRRGGDWQTRDCFIAKRRGGADGRTDEREAGHLLTSRAFLPARTIQHGSADESYSSGDTVIVMRGTYLYRKRVLFHWPRHNVYKGPTARCRALRAHRSFYIFHSRDR